jgi:hypothetical protein
MAEGGVRVCTCEDWFEGMRQIDTLFVIAHRQGFAWTYKGFYFCPWCGKKLEHMEILI